MFARFRLRSLLVLLALVPLLGHGAFIARYGSIKDFRQHHGRQAYHCWAFADDCKLRWELVEGRLESHGDQWTTQEIEDALEKIEKFQRLEREYLRKSQWHQFWSGRPVLMVRT